MSKKPKELTYEQAKELKWFCQNVMSVRKDMYDAIADVQKFTSRIARLEKTCALVEAFLGEEIKARPEVDWTKP